MGCVSSRPSLAAGSEDTQIREPSKSATARARRVSIHVQAGLTKGLRSGQPGSAPGTASSSDGGGQEAAGASTRAGAGSAGGGAGAELPTSSAQVLARNHGTRSRRLSYVTKDEMARKLAEQGLGGEQEDPLGADVAHASAPEREQQQREQQQREQQDKEGGGQTPGQRPPAPGAVQVSVACMSRAGREPGYKKTNQDSCFAFEKFVSDDTSLFGAMDGHGPNGHLVSAFVKQHLPILLVDPLASGASPRQTLNEGFLEVDARLGASRIDCEFSGSTCVVAHLKGTRLTTAWVGDSRCVLGRQAPGEGLGWEAVELTFDHKPTNPGERERIARCQGRVERLVDDEGQHVGPYRVWLQYAWVPGLAMSRALGDQLAHQVGVSSEPQHMELDLTPRDKFIILASDGVWEFITSREAVELVGTCSSPEEACQALINEAHHRWLVEEDGVVDDITAVIVHLTHPGHAPAAAQPREAQ